MSLRVARAGMLTTVQDLGRAGHQHDGVGEGGAMDGVALRLANLLVGNGEGAAGLEVTLAGPELVAERDTLVALAGADLGAAVDGRPLAPWRAARVAAGATLSLGTSGSARAGCRAYLAVAGGVDVAPVLGSRGTDLRGGFGGLGGRALRRGDVVPVGAPSSLARRIAAALPLAEGARLAVAGWGIAPSLRTRAGAGAAVIRLLPGAHAGALTPASRERLYGDEFRVAAESDRMGYRLEGATLELSAPLEILSEAVAFGTVQLPPAGRPIVLMADRQTTGGYPRVGEVATVDLPLLAQLRPGDRLRFRPVSLDAAQALYLERERDIALARRAIELRFR